MQSLLEPGSISSGMCPEPPLVSSAEMQEIFSEDNVRYAIYTCFYGYQFLAGGTIRTIVCMTSGQWSATELTCLGMLTASFIAVDMQNTENILCFGQEFEYCFHMLQRTFAETSAQSCRKCFYTFAGCLKGTSWHARVLLSVWWVSFFLAISCPPLADTIDVAGVIYDASLRQEHLECQDNLRFLNGRDVLDIECSGRGIWHREHSSCQERYLAKVSSIWCWWWCW